MSFSGIHEITSVCVCVHTHAFLGEESIAFIRISKGSKTPQKIKNF